MIFETILINNDLILTECAISERLRRQHGVELHPLLFNTPLIYDEVAREHLVEIYLSYRQIAAGAKLPLLLCAPTWRVDRERINGSGVPLTINRDAVAFMIDLKNDHWLEDSPVVAGALLAPKNDCYRPDLALGRAAASDYHACDFYK